MNLDYRVFFSKRKTLSLIAKYNRSIIVRTLRGTSPQIILKDVKSKKLRLYEKIRHPQKYPLARIRKKFVFGGTTPDLGHHYRLEASRHKYAAYNFIHALSSHTKICLRHDLFTEWYVIHIKECLMVRTHYLAESVSMQCNLVFVSDMRVRWGFCILKNNLNLNCCTIKSPSLVVDYLAVHELAHLVRPNHTSCFWNIVAVQVPKY